MSLFDILMINLTTCMNEEKRLRECNPDRKSGEKRYKIDMIGITPDCDAISVYQSTENGLSFAKRVAEHYGCRYKMDTHEKCPEGGEFELKIYF